MFIQDIFGKECQLKSFSGASSSAGIFPYLKSLSTSYVYDPNDSYVFYSNSLGLYLSKGIYLHTVVRRLALDLYIINPFTLGILYQRAEPTSFDVPNHSPKWPISFWKSTRLIVFDCITEIKFDVWYQAYSSASILNMNSINLLTLYSSATQYCRW